MGSAGLAPALGAEWKVTQEEKEKETDFFQSEQAASTWLTAHAEAVVLSIEEAALVGRLVAETRFTEKHA